MRLLHGGGINEYEDPDRPFSRGHVQVMTIHQAKGLEFPVVVVGSLSTRLTSPKRIDRDLGSFRRDRGSDPRGRVRGHEFARSGDLPGMRFANAVPGRGCHRRDW